MSFEVFTMGLEGRVRQFFSGCVEKGAECAGNGEHAICYTPIRWMVDGLNEVLVLWWPTFPNTKLESLHDVDAFHPSGFASSFHQEFILIDVVLLNIDACQYCPCSLGWS